MKRVTQWLLGIAVAAGIVLVPVMHYRATYAHGKRLREVEAGQFYRCGQLTSDGFRDAIKRYGIRTVINLQDEDPDPLMPETFYNDRKKTLESKVCDEAGAKYVMLSFDMPRRDQAPFEHAKAIDNFLALMDKPESRPALLHCKAGLHRTGLLTAIYRMEYDRWSRAEVMRELRANGFGDAAAHTGNDYIWSYIENYTPRWQRKPAVTSAEPAP